MAKAISILLILALLLSLMGCKAQNSTAANTATPTPVQTIDLEAYLADVKMESDSIKAALEQEELTQTEMNEKSKALADLWDAALNTLLAEAQKTLSAADYEQLAAEQSAWEEQRKTAVEAAGKEFEGGSMYALAVNAEAANLTEARVTVLAQMLKKAN